jgi:hypothetical protein
VLQDKAPEGNIFCGKGRKSRQTLPAVRKNSRNRVAVAFADCAIITMPI